MPASDWPTGPIEPAPAPATIHLVPTCTDGTCPTCQASRAGGDTIARMVGVEPDAVPRDVREHYAAIATEVYAAMSEKLIELGVISIKEPHDG